MRELYFGLFRATGMILPLGYYSSIDEVELTWGENNLTYVWTASQLHRAYSYAMTLNDGMVNPDLEDTNDPGSW